MFQQCEQMNQTLQRFQTEKTELRSRLSSLKKLEDSKDFNNNKKLSTGPQKSKSEKSGGGFTLVHLVLVAVISLLLGALITKTRGTASFELKVNVG